MLARRGFVGAGPRPARRSGDARAPRVRRGRSPTGPRLPERRDSRHDLPAPGAELPRIVDELRRLDTDRRETSGDLPGDPGERLVQVGHAVRAREAAARAADELELAEVAPGVGERGA